MDKRVTVRYKPVPPPPKPEVESVTLNLTPDQAGLIKALLGRCNGTEFNLYTELFDLAHLPVYAVNDAAGNRIPTIHPVKVP